MFARCVSASLYRHCVGITVSRLARINRFKVFAIVNGCFSYCVTDDFLIYFKLVDLRFLSGFQPKGIETVFRRNGSRNIPDCNRIGIRVIFPSWRFRCSSVIFQFQRKFKFFCFVCCPLNFFFNSELCGLKGIYHLSLGSITSHNPAAVAIRAVHFNVIQPEVFCFRGSNFSHSVGGILGQIGYGHAVARANQHLGFAFGVKCDFIAPLQAGSRERFVLNRNRVSSIRQRHFKGEVGNLILDICFFKLFAQLKRTRGRRTNHVVNGRVQGLNLVRVIGVQFVTGAVHAIYNNRAAEGPAQNVGICGGRQNNASADLGGIKQVRVAGAIFTQIVQHAGGVRFAALSIVSIQQLTVQEHPGAEGLPIHFNVQHDIAAIVVKRKAVFGNFGRLYVDDAHGVAALGIGKIVGELSQSLHIGLDVIVLVRRCSIQYDINLFSRGIGCFCLFNSCLIRFRIRDDNDIHTVCLLEHGLELVKILFFPNRTEVVDVDVIGKVGLVDAEVVEDLFPANLSFIITVDNLTANNLFNIIIARSQAVKFQFQFTICIRSASFLIDHFSVPLQADSDFSLNRCALIGCVDFQNFQAVDVHVRAGITEIRQEVSIHEIGADGGFNIAGMAYIIQGIVTKVCGVVQQTVDISLGDRAGRGVQDQVVVVIGDMGFIIVRGCSISIIQVVAVDRASFGNKHFGLAVLDLAEGFKTILGAVRFHVICVNLYRHSFVAGELFIRQLSAIPVVPGRDREIDHCLLTRNRDLGPAVSVIRGRVFDCDEGIILVIH